jgi:hypothetical protein
MFAAITNNPDVGFVFAVVAFLLAAIAVVQSKAQAILPWAVVALSAGAALVWWML